MAKIKYRIRAESVPDSLPVLMLFRIPYSRGPDGNFVALSEAMSEREAVIHLMNVAVSYYPLTSSGDELMAQASADIVQRDKLTIEGVTAYILTI